MAGFLAKKPKRRPDTVRRANRTVGMRTLLLLFVFGVAGFMALFGKLYEWQITRHDELQDIAVRQQTMHHRQRVPRHDLRSQRPYAGNFLHGGEYPHVAPGHRAV